MSWGLSFDLSGLPFCRSCLIRVLSLWAMDDGNGFGKRMAHKIYHTVYKAVCICPRESFQRFYWTPKGWSQKRLRCGALARQGIGTLGEGRDNARRNSRHSLSSPTSLCLAQAFPRRCLLSHSLDQRYFLKGRRKDKNVCQYLVGISA